jgi:hypothetical protein
MTLSDRNKLDSVYLYSDPSIDNLELDKIQKFLKDALPESRVETRGDLLTVFRDSYDIDGLAGALASMKVRNVHAPETEFQPLKGEIDFEKGLLTDRKKKVFGIMYDGFRLHNTLQGLLPASELRTDICHIIFTNRLFGTFDPKDGRYHARVIICGFPSIVSTTGVVVAPAKPKEYYLRRQLSPLGGLGATDLDKGKQYGDFIDFDDARMTEVMKGYALQCIFYSLRGEPFCDDEDCRLFNAHWQREVIRAQLTSGCLCRRHERVLSDQVG